MSRTLLIIVAAIYLYVALDYYRSNQRGMALAFAAYALANIGFMIDLGRK